MTLRLLPKQLLISRKKSALAKVKKAEKALADAEKEHHLREHAVAERLQTMSTAAEGTHFAFPLLRLLVCFLVLLLKNSFPTFPVSFVIQDSPGYLCRLYSPAMIL
jgi:hypothetical protein